MGHLPKSIEMDIFPSSGGGDVGFDSGGGEPYDSW